MSETFAIYLLHFEPKLGHNGHYMGSTKAVRLNARLREHAAAHGAKLTARAAKAGTAMYLARVWLVDDRREEMRLKRMGSKARLCPICRKKLVALQLPLMFDRLPSFELVGDWKPYGWTAIDIRP